jgi:hypothetical protein
MEDIMKHMLKFSQLTILLFAFSFTLYGQTVTEDTLYNQALTPSGNLQTSSHFFENGVQTTYSCMGADDFVTTQQWKITKVFVLGGFYNGSQNPQTFHTVFYADDNTSGDYPGTELYNSYNTVEDNGSGGFTIPIEDEIILPPGHYWISVYANVASGYATWGWKPSAGAYNYEADWKNPGDGFGTGYTDWTPITTVFQGTTETEYSFALFGIKGTPASNPDPENNALAVDLNTDISWDNPPNSDSVEVFFGSDPENLSSIYYGTPITSINVGTLDYYTHYYWRVFEINENGRSTGLLWNFTTIVDPTTPLYADFEDHVFPPPGWSYEYENENWWYITIYSSYGVGNYCALQSFYSAPAGNISSLVTQTFLPTGLNDTLSFDHAYASDLFGWDDQLEIFYSLDAGSTWTSLVLLHGGMNGELVTAPPVDYFVPDSSQWGTMKFVLPQGTNRIKFTGISATGNNLYLDKIQVIPSVVPVELISFTGIVKNENVILNWSTETEKNNSGFEIQRFKELKTSQSQNWNVVGFVKGQGTTTEQHNYSFTDENVSTGQYQYRFKQIDYNGSFKYSNAIKVNVLTPTEFSLEQNFPNPFNPTTTIKYSIPLSTKIIIRVFDVLGNQIAVLVNEKKPAGNYKLTWNAANLPSGVYFYRLKAGNFVETKKMILLK